MKRRLAATVTLATVLAAGCEKATYIPAPRRPVLADMADWKTDKGAMLSLTTDQGPSRFARVTEGLYRGGQPTRAQLVQLKKLGVNTIINLRREDSGARAAEAAAARELGMRFVHFPFYGVFGADPAFLRRILKEMDQPGVYIHCKHGRDRTSLLVALYRVLKQGWDPREAWQREVLDYGYQPTYFYRKLRDSFVEMVELRGGAAAL